MADPLSKNAIKKALDNLPGWSHDDNRLRKEYTFDDFRQAMSFITRIAFEAEEAVHHPELFNVYNTVKIALSTHDAGGKVTQKDVALAKKIESISNQFSE